MLDDLYYFLKCFLVAMAILFAAFCAVQFAQKQSVDYGMYLNRQDQNKVVYDLSHEKENICSLGKCKPDEDEADILANSALYAALTTNNR